MKSSSNKFAVGAAVQWKWLGRAILGTIQEVYLEPITKTIKGKAIKRNGSAENPAYVVESESGNLALKLHTELELRTENKSKASRPKMFGN